MFSLNLYVKENCCSLLIIFMFLRVSELKYDNKVMRCLGTETLNTCTLKYGIGR